MFDVIKDYALKRVDLLKLEATEKGVVSAGFATVFIFIALFLIFFLILLNIGIAFLIGEALDNYGYGFLIVAGVYLLLIILMVVLMKPIKDMVANKLIKIIFND